MQKAFSAGYIFDTDHVLHITYEELANTQIDIGFRTVFEQGVDHHQVTRDITVSIQNVRDHLLYNTLYINGKPVRIELEDEDLTPYVSDYVECRYVVSGHFEMEIDGEAAGFDEGEICFINSAGLHRELLKTSECIVINFNISRSFFTEPFLSSIVLSPLQKFLRSNFLHLGHKEKYLRLTPAPGDGEAIKNAVFIILNEGRAQDPGYQDICRGHIIRMIDKLASSYHYNFSKKDSSTYYDTLFESIREFMEQHISTVTLRDLTTLFHYQPNFLNNLIKRYTGMTYSDYLIALRIEHARILLETTTLPVDEIIWLVGYHNRGFFYRRFVEHTGITPARYRKEQHF